MRAAIVETATGLVTNIIVAEAIDPWPDAASDLVSLPDDSPVGPGWVLTAGQWVEPVKVDE